MPKVPKSIRIGCAGAGRAGKVHLMRLETMKDVEIAAICTPDLNEQAWVRQNYPEAAVYSDYASFLEHGSDNGTPGLDCVWIATPTVLHKEQFIQALSKGLHVFCEKPLSSNPEDAQAMYEAALKHPHLKAVCAFPRRFDKGYLAARQRIERGDIGDIILVRSQLTDQLDTTGWFVAYARNSGGIFVDSGIHDIDACLFLMAGAAGEKPDALDPTSAYGLGTTRVFPELAEFKDADNALGLIQFKGGAMATIMCSRTNVHGHHSMTEIVGTKGKMIINSEPRKLNLEISDQNGTRIEAAVDHLDLFDEAYTSENRAFVDWVLYGTVPTFNMRDAVLSVRIGLALQTSLREGRKVLLNETTTI